MNIVYLNFTAGKEFVCPTNYGSFEDPSGKDCAVYYICVNGEPQIATCAPGLVFDSTIKQCNWKANVPSCA